MIGRLLRRLASPTVAVGLSKEELCLALAATARLHAMDALPPTSRCDRAQSVTPCALALRARRVAPLCTSQELAMLATGATALAWTQPELIGCLIIMLHRHCEDASAQGGLHTAPVRLAEMTAVLEAAAAACRRGSSSNNSSGNACCCNATLWRVVLRHGVPALQSEARRTVQRFVVAAASAAALLPEPCQSTLHECMKQSMHAALSTSEAKVQWEAWRRAFADTQPQQSASHKVSADESTSHGGGCDDDDNGGPVWSETVARSHIVHYVLRQSCQAGVTASPVTPTVTLAEMLQGFVYYAIHDDVVAERALEAAAMATLTSQSEGSTGLKSSAELDAIRRVVYAAPVQLFPRLRDILARAASPTTQVRQDAADDSVAALQSVGAVTPIYEAMLRGEQVDEEVLFRLTRELDMGLVDEVARAACVMARYGTVPEAVVVALQDEHQLSRLSLSGLAAFMRAAWLDHSGALFGTALATALRCVNAETALRSATRPQLEALLSALNTPRPRRFTADAALQTAERGLCETLLSHLLYRVDTALPVRDAVALVAAAGAVVDPDDELLMMLAAQLTRALAARPCRADEDDETYTQLALAALELMTARDSLQPTLLAVLAPRMRTCVQHCLAGSSNMEGTAWQSYLLRFASLQATLNAPELQDMSAELLHHVATGLAAVETWSGGSSEVLLAAGLLALRAGKYDLLLRIQAGLQRLPWEASLPVWWWQAIVRLLWQCPRMFVDVELLDSLLARAAMAPMGLVGVLLALYARTSAARPQRVSCAATQDGVRALVQRGKRGIYGFAPDAYTTLCAYAYCCDETLLEDDFVNCLVEQLPRRLDELTPRQIATALAGLGEVRGAGQRLSHQIMTSAVVDYVVDNVDLFWSGRDIARLLYGMAKLHCTKRSLFSVFATQLARRPVLATLDRPSISLALAAFGLAKFLDQRLFDRLARVFVAHAAELTPADLLLAVKAHGRVMLLNNTFYDEMGRQLVRHAAELPPEAQCEVLLAYGANQVANDELAACLLGRLATDVGQLPDANAAVEVLTAVWYMDFDLTSSEAAGTIANYVAAHAAELHSGSLLKLCSVLSDTMWRHAPLLVAVATQSVHLKSQEQLSAETSRAVLDTLAIHRVHSPTARDALSSLARSVSKDCEALTGDETPRLASLHAL